MFYEIYLLGMKRQTCMHLTNIYILLRLLYSNMHACLHFSLWKEIASFTMITPSQYNGKTIDAVYSILQFTHLKATNKGKQLLLFFISRHIYTNSFLSL